MGAAFGAALALEAAALAEKGPARVGIVLGAEFQDPLAFLLAWPTGCS